MKIALTILMASSFILIAVFGFWLMTDEMMQGHESCIATVLQGGACLASNPFAVVSYHFNALASFFSANFKTLSPLSLFFALALLLLLGAVFNSSKFSYLNLPSFLQRIFVSGYKQNNSRFLSWLEIKEKRDPQQKFGLSK